MLGHQVDARARPAPLRRCGRPPSVSKFGIFLAVVRRAGPRLIEASLIPTALFYCCLVFAGIGVAYAAALIWLYSALLVRLVRSGRVSPLLILAAVGITIRTILSVAQDSSFLYFVQPVLGSVVAGVVFLGSIALGRPIVHALAHDFWPLTPEMLDCPGVVPAAASPHLPLGRRELRLRGRHLHPPRHAPAPGLRGHQAVRQLGDHRRGDRHHHRPLGPHRPPGGLRRRTRAEARRPRGRRRLTRLVHS